MNMVKLSILFCLAIAAYDVAGSSFVKQKLVSNLSSKQSILDQLSPSTLKQLLTEISSMKDDNSNQECKEDFGVLDSQIIRTKDSLKNGATFLHALPNVESALECKKQCCSYSDDSAGTVLKCNVAVYQLQQVDDKPRCFLFDCYNKDTGKFSCLFSSNRGFTSYKGPESKISADVQLQELEDIVQSQPQITSTSETSTTTTTTTTTKPTTTSTATTKPTTTSAATTKPTTTSTTTTKPTTTSTTTTKPTTTSQSTTTSTTSTGAIVTTSKVTTASTTLNTANNKPISSISHDINACSSQQCQRFEWQCDNKCCIPYRNICDGIPHCSDGSDEVACPTVAISSDQADLEKILLTTTSKAMKNTLTTTTHLVPSPTSSSTLMPELDKSTTTTVAKVKDDRSPVDPEAGAVLPLAIGLAVTACVLLMVACRVRIMKRKLRRRGKPLLMDESDYLVNGMYL